MMKRKVLFPLYLCVVILLILLLFEFVILPRHFGLPRNLALIGFAAKPGITIDDTSTNSMGFTGDVIREEKETGKIRILTLGGSVIFNRRMTERLKEKIESVTDRPVEILGAALRTHTSMSSLLKYRALSGYGFDYVLIYHSINDLFVNHVKDKYFRDDYSHMMPWYKRNYLLDNSLVARVIYNNFIWGKRLFGMEKVWYIYPRKDEENAMEFVSEKLFRRNLAEIVTGVRKNGGIPVLMTFAWNIPENYTQESFVAGEAGYASSEYTRYPVELWGSVDFVREGLRRHNSVIRDIAEHYDVLLIDQENMMKESLQWFEDVCHFSDEGTDRFIMNITDYFAENGLLEL